LDLHHRTLPGIQECRDIGVVKKVAILTGGWEGPYQAEYQETEQAS